MWIDARSSSIPAISRNIGAMTMSPLPLDPKWPRANSLFSKEFAQADVGLIGIPAHKTSISPTSSHLTPMAIRNSLGRYSTYSASIGVDLRDSAFADLGDVDDPDFEEGRGRVKAAVQNARRDFKLLIALGGDNSITHSVASGMWRDLSKVGLITLDAHHDLRDGDSNGSPVQQLIEAGVAGTNVVQIGISDFANSKEYSERARQYGITVVNREILRKRPMQDVMAEALEIAGKDGNEIYVDLDVDVCDRSVAPACPASVPGGISADELRIAARVAASDARVRGMDITEIDASLDTPDQRTIRLAALLVLEAAAGVALR